MLHRDISPILSNERVVYVHLNSCGSERMALFSLKIYFYSKRVAVSVELRSRVRIAIPIHVVFSFLNTVHKLICGEISKKIEMRLKARLDRDFAL